MAVSGLNYIISVQLEQLRDLQQLHDTISAIQQLSAQGAEFNVRVNAQSLEDLSQSIGKAVSSGFSRGGGRIDLGESSGRPAGGRSAGSVEVDTSKIEQSITRLAQVLSGVGGDGGERPRGPAAVRATASSGRTSQLVKANEELLQLFDDVIAGRIKQTEDVKDRMRRGLGRRVMSNINQAMETDFGDPLSTAEIRSEMTSPTRLRETVAQRLEKLRAREARYQSNTPSVTASPSSGGPGNAAFTVALDAKVLSQAFEQGATKMADAMRKGIQDAATSLGTIISEAVARGLGRGGGANSDDDIFPPSRKDPSATYRATAYGVSPEEISKTRQAYANQLDTLRAELNLRKDIQENDRKKLAALKALEAQGKTVKGLEGFGERITKAQAIIDEVVGQIAVVEAHINNASAQLSGTGQSMRPNFMSRAQLAQAQATLELAPGGVEAGALRRGARGLDNLSTREGMLFNRAADAGVMAVPQIFDRLLTSRVTGTGESKLISEEIGRLIPVRQGLKETLDSEKDPIKREQIRQDLGQTQRSIDELQIRKQGEYFAGVNRTIDSSVTQYMARLQENRDRDMNQEGLTSQDALRIDREYNTKMGALRFSTERVRTLRSEEPNLNREMLLLPQALAEYVRTTLEQYRDALENYSTKKQPIPEPLLEEIRSNDLLKAVAGKAPGSPREAAGALAGVQQFLTPFGELKTAFELIRPRGMYNKPVFSPDLENDTVPFDPNLEDGGDGRTLSREVRARWLAGYANRGGAFAPLTEERREWSEKEFRSLMQRDIGLGQSDTEFGKAKLEPLSDSERRRMLDLSREMEFGGQYYFKNSPEATGGDIVDGVLVSPQERARVSKGGVRSKVIGPALNAPSEGGGEAGEAALSGEVKLARQFMDAMGGVENSLARVNKTMQELSTVSFDPVIRETLKLVEALKPYADMMDKLSKVMTASVTASPASKKFAERIELERGVQEARTAGDLQRLKNKQLFGPPSEALRGELPALAGVVDPDNIPAMSNDPAVLRDLVLRGRKQVGTSQMRIMDLMRKREAMIGAGMGGESTQRTLNRETANFDALMGGFAQNVGALAGAQPQFFDDARGASLAADAVLRTQSQKRVLGDNFRLVQEAEERIKRLDAEDSLFRDRSSEYRSAVYTEKKADTFIKAKETTLTDLRKQFTGLPEGEREGAAGQRLQAEIDKIEKELRKATEVLKRSKTTVSEIDRERELAKERGKLRTSLTGLVGERFDALQKAGIVGANDPRTLDTLKQKHGEVNTQLGKQYDGLMQITKGSVDAANAGGNFLDRIADKVQRLSAYVAAGGVVYTIASQLRQATREAIGLETDIRRIQGVLPSRSSVQAGIIGEGIVQGALDYGTPLRQSVQSGKLFAQTGANVDQTIQLTRASLAAQVGAGLEANQATELLIAVENISRGQIKSFEILDRISRIEAQYAVTAQDLSAAIQRAGSLATQLQPQALGAVDAIDLIIGSATTIIERTRVSGDQAATALRFIVSRLAAPDVSRALQSRFGIKLAGDTPTELRPLQDILADVANKFKDLKSSGNTVQAQQLLATFAGARQANVAAALLEGFDEAMITASRSALAFGDTQERVRLQLDTVEAQLSRFNTAFSAFAASLLNDTGLGTLLKTVLSAGTSVLSQGSAAQSGLAIAGIGLAGGLAARAGGRAISTRLGERAQNAAAQAVDGDGIKRLMAPGVMGAAGANGARLAGWGGRALMSVGGVATGIGAVIALTSLAEIAAEYFTRAKRVADLTSSERFDRGFFQNTPFYQNYRERAMNYSLAPEQLSRVTTEQLLAVTREVDGMIDSGQINQNQRYTTTVDKLVEKFDELIPGFADLGDKATRASEALNILKESAKLGMAIPQTYIDDYLRDVNDIFAPYERDRTKISERLSAPMESWFEYGLRQFGQAASKGQTGRPFAITPRQSVSPTADNIIGQLNEMFTSNGKQFLDLGKIGLGPGVPERGGIPVRLRDVLDRGGNDPLGAADRYFKERLFVSGSERRAFDTAEARILARRKDSSDRVVSTEEKYQEALVALTNATQENRDALGDAKRRYENQQQVVNRITAELEANLGKDNRLGQLSKEFGDVPDRPGGFFEATINQILAQVRTNLEKNARRDVEGRLPQDIREMIRSLEKLQSPASRFAQNAQTQINTVSVRDRLVDPIVAFGARAAEIRVQDQLRERYGVSYDAVQAQAENARQLLGQVNQVPIEIARELLRDQAKFVASGGRSQAVRRLAGQIVDDERSPGLSGISNALGEGLDLAEGVSSQDREALLQRINTLSQQLDLSLNKSLGGLLSSVENLAPSDPLRQTAEGMKDTIAKLGQLTGDPVTEKTLSETINFVGSLTELLEMINNNLGDRIRAPILRDRRLAAMALGSQDRLQDIQLGSSRQQAELQVRLAQLQADPRQAQQALDAQRALIEVSRQARLSTAEETLRATLARLSELPDSEDVQRQLMDASSLRDREVRAANAEADNAQFTTVGGLNTQLQRRQREDSLQLVQDITAPLRTFLMSSRNFSRQGYQGLVEGVGQAAQQRLVDMFMRRMFSEAGLMGNVLTNAFQNGGITTQTAIERGFANGVAELSLALNGAGVAGAGAGSVGSGASSGGVDGEGGVPVEVAGAVVGAAGATRTSSGSQTIWSRVKGANWREVYETAGPLAGSLIGAEIGPKDRPSYAGEGAAVGAMVGNMLLPGVGGFVGGLLGGGLGSLLGKKEDKPEPQIAALERIERNTRQQIEAIENQTRMLSLESRFLNVPAGFVVPSFRPFGSSAGEGGTQGAEITINVYASEGQSEQLIATKVADALRTQLGGAGRSFDVRNM